MSNEPTSQRLLAPVPDGPAEALSEADRMAAAVQRMETAVRTERSSIEQLRADFAEMMQSVAQIRAAVTAIGRQHVEVDGLLAQFEARAQSMAARLAPLPSVTESETPAAIAETVAEPRPPEEQAFLDAIGTGPIAETKTVTDQVPTVSGVVSQLGRADPAEASEPADASGRTTVAMLEAMVEELTAAMPLRPSPEDETAESVTAEIVSAEIAATPVAEPEAADTEPTPPDSEAAETAAAEPAAFDVGFVEAEPAPVASLPEDMPPAPASEAEAAPHEFVATEFGAAVPPEATTIEIETAERPPSAIEADAATTEPAMLDAEAIRDVPAAASSPPAEPQDVAPEEPAAEHIPSQQMQAAPAPEFAPPPAAVMPDVDLMSNFARMEAVPYLRSEIGTAVIFEKPKLESLKLESPMPAAEDRAPDVVFVEPPRREAPAAAAPHESLSAKPGAPFGITTAAFEEPILVVPPPDPDEPDEPAVARAAPLPPGILQIEARAQPLEPDLDALLFGATDADPDPAAFLLDPAPWPQHAAAVSERAEIPPAPQTLATSAKAAAPAAAAAQAPNQAAPRHDPLAALKAMSEEEKIALFE